jgi:hypothetical protein
MVAAVIDRPGQVWSGRMDRYFSGMAVGRSDSMRDLQARTIRYNPSCTHSRDAGWRKEERKTRQELRVRWTTSDKRTRGEKNRVTLNERTTERRNKRSEGQIKEKKKKEKQHFGSDQVRSGQVRSTGARARGERCGNKTVIDRLQANSLMAGSMKRLQGCSRSRENKEIAIKLDLEKNWKKVHHLRLCQNGCELGRARLYTPKQTGSSVT